MPSKTNKNGITEDTGKLWGLICIVPFGWIFFMASLISRKNDVIKRGTLKPELALKVLQNYMAGFWVVTVLVILSCVVLSSSSRGMNYYPNLIAIIVIPITYYIVKNQIIDFENNKKTRKRKTSRKK
ncbi:hypothetical protein IKF67_02820 [Candidatus Saccharibacteria bacterium]|nr:hypothetical protein [Candidatus Saccharibacteria bacterium]